MPSNQYPSRDFSDPELKFSYWYVTHKIALRRGFIVFLITVGCSLWFFVGWQMVFYTINVGPESVKAQNLFSDQSSLSAGLESLRPRELQFSNIRALSRGDGSYDYLLTASNPNPRWLAIFDYQFSQDADSDQVKTAYILPGEQKNILAFAGSGQDAQFTLFSVDWERVNNYEQIRDNRLRLSVSGEKFTPPRQAGDPSIVSFVINNNSAYSYWTVDTKILLLSGGQVVSGNHIVLDQLISGESRDIDVIWNTNLPVINGIQIMPEVNIFDEDNIMPVR